MSNNLHNYMNDNESSLNDLIQLFLDGESTDIENELLFSVLANNKVAQAEFQAAVQAGTLLRTVAQAQQPPVELASLVMQRVGFGVAATGTATSLSLFLRSISTSFNGTKILGAIGLITLGAVATLFYEHWQDSNEKTISGTVQQTTTIPAPIGADGTTGHEAPAAVNSSAQAEGAVTHAAAGTANTFAAKPSAAHMVVTADRRMQKDRGIPRTKEFSQSYHHQELGRKAQRGVLATEAGGQEERVFTQNHTNDMLSTVALGQEQRQNPISFNGWDDRKPTGRWISPASGSFLLPDSDSDGVDAVPDAVWLRSMSALSHYPSRSDSYTGNFGDIDFCLLFNVGKNFALGVEFGSEHLPSFIPTNDGSLVQYTYQENISWGGATLWYKLPQPLLFQDLYAFASVSLGQSNAGPLGKMQVGSYYALFDDFRIGASVDATAVVFKNSSGWQSAGRSGVSIMAGYQF